MLEEKNEVGFLGMNLTRFLKSVPFSEDLRLKNVGQKM